MYLFGIPYPTLGLVDDLRSPCGKQAFCLCNYTLSRIYVYFAGFLIGLNLVAGLSPPTVAILSPSTPPSVLPSAVAHCTRWLKALHEILTEFSSMRLPAQKAALGAASIDIARVVAPLETQLMDQLLEEQMCALLCCC